MDGFYELRWGAQVGLTPGPRGDGVGTGLTSSWPGVLRQKTGVVKSRLSRHLDHRRSSRSRGRGSGSILRRGRNRIRRLSWSCCAGSQCRMYVCMDRTASVGIRRAGCRICDREYVFPRPFLISCLDVVLIGWGERERSWSVRPSSIGTMINQSRGDEGDEEARGRREEASQ